MNEFEIVGLFEDSNGRSCERHRVCGDTVRVGDVLRMKKTIVEYNGKVSEAIKFVSIVNGCESCTVGFLSKYLVARATAEGCQDCFVKVIRLYATSENRIECRKSHNNRGMALCALIPHIDGILSLE
jgi:hypothetical protein